MGTRTRTRKPETLKQDRAVISGLQRLAEYTPRNPQHTQAALQTLEAEVSSDEQALHDGLRTVALLRSRFAASTEALHTAVQGAKVEVVSQFGDDSFAMRAIGLKPRSERKPPTRNKAPKE